MTRFTPRTRSSANLLISGIGQPMVSFVALLTSKANGHAREGVLSTLAEGSTSSDIGMAKLRTMVFNHILVNEFVFYKVLNYIY